MDGLDAVAKVHPFVAGASRKVRDSHSAEMDIAYSPVAVLSFMTRRENNKKVNAIRVDMQDMMCVLFQ
jgi:hypothetical protein